MVEIPEHLLKRSQSARERLTGQAPAADASSEVDDSQISTPAAEIDTPIENSKEKIEETKIVVEDAP